MTHVFGEHESRGHSSVASRRSDRITFWPIASLVSTAALYAVSEADLACTSWKPACGNGKAT